MDIQTIILIGAGVLALIAVFALGAYFAPGRAKVTALVQAAEVKSFQTIVSETMLAWRAEQSRRAQALAVEQAALAADKAAFAETQKAVAAMTTEAASVPAAA